MRKFTKYLLLSVLIFALAFTFVACRREFTVKFDANYGVGAYQDQVIKRGGEATNPGTPEREGYIFKYWGVSRDAASAFDFASRITGHLDLYAVWEKIPPPLVCDICEQEPCVCGIPVICDICEQEPCVCCICICDYEPDNCECECADCTEVKLAILDPRYAVYIWHPGGLVPEPILMPGFTAKGFAASELNEAWFAEWFNAKMDGVLFADVELFLEDDFWGEFVIDFSDFEDGIVPLNMFDITRFEIENNLFFFWRFIEA